MRRQDGSKAFLLYMLFKFFIFSLFSFLPHVIYCLKNPIRFKSYFILKGKANPTMVLTPARLCAQWLSY